MGLKLANKKIKLGILVAFPFLVYLIPRSDFFNGHSICLLKNLFGIECWGCGITRAVVSVMYFDFESAWGYNRLVVVVLPLLVYLWVKYVIATLKDTKAKSRN